MLNPVCGSVRLWLRQAARSSSSVPPEELVEHIAGCPTCKGAILLTLTDLLALGPEMGELDCAACEGALAAYLELELEDGGAAALRAYPLVARHLWSCPDCAELYRLTRAAILAARAGTLARPPLLARAERQPLALTAIRLSRAFLNKALPPPNLLLGAARGPDSGPEVLYENDESGHLVSLAAARMENGDWSISVTVMPPVEGRLLLSVGVRSWTAPFTAGRATVADLAAAILEDESGPDLLGTITVEPAPA